MTILSPARFSLAIAAWTPGAGGSDKPTNPPKTSPARRTHGCVACPAARHGEHAQSLGREPFVLGQQPCALVRASGTVRHPVRVLPHISRTMRGAPFTNAVNPPCADGRKTAANLRSLENGIRRTGARSMTSPVGMSRTLAARRMAKSTGSSMGRGRPSAPDADTGRLAAAAASSSAITLARDQAARCR